MKGKKEGTHRGRKRWKDEGKEKSVETVGRREEEKRERIWGI